MSTGPHDYQFRTTPRDHQVVDLVRGWGLPAWARFHEMRTGKGVLTCYEMDAMAQAGLASRFLVVCPKRVLSTWQEMIRTHVLTDFFICLHEPDLADITIKLHGPRPVILLTNYDRVWSRIGSRVLSRSSLMDWMPQYIVADEAHKIKNRTSNRSKAMHTLGRLATYRRVLTGTPDPTAYSDYFSIYKFLDPSIFGTWTDFAARYLVLDWYRCVVGYHNTDELARKIHSIGSRVRRADCLDVPDVEEQVVEVDLPTQARKVYRNLAKSFYAELSAEHTISAPIVLTKLLRLAQVTGGFVNTNEGQHVWLHDAKVEALIDVLEEVLADAGAKAVVFARFRPEITRISDRLRTAHIPHEVLHGDTKDDAAVRWRFAGRECRVLVSQIATGSLGVDLSVAETAIFYSWDYDAATYQQARDRIWKPDGKLTYIYIVVPSSVDSTMLRVVQGKVERSSLLLDRWNEWVGAAV